MLHSQIQDISRVKISGDDQPKNLAMLTEWGYDIYFIEATIESDSGEGREPYFYYEALRHEEILHAVTPKKLLQLASKNAHEPGA